MKRSPELKPVWWDALVVLAVLLLALLLGARPFLQARQAGAQIVVLGILPYGGPHASGTSAPNVWRRKVNVALMKMAKDADVSYLDVSSDFRLPNGDTDPAMMPSDVHPSKKGFAALERRLSEVR